MASSSTAPATARTMPAFANMPVLAASTPMSVATARICSPTSVGAIASYP